MGKAMAADTGTGLDIGALIDSGAFTSFQKRAVALAALGFAVDGLANQVLGIAIPALVADWHAPRSAFAPIAAAGLLGVALGTAAGGLLGDRFGRRAGLIFSVLLFGLLTAAASWADGPGTLLWLRFIAGLGIGGAIPNGAALIADFTPARRRSLAIALGMVFIPVGAVLAGVIGAWVLAGTGWRGLFLITGAAPVLLGLALLVLLPESPRFLARSPARRPQLQRTMSQIGHVLAPESVLLEETQGPRTPLSALFGPAIRRDTLALWSAFFFCFLAMYSMLSWVPTMLASRGFPLSAASLGITGFNIGGMTGGVLGGWAIERLGSRRAILGFTAAGVLGAVALGLLSFDPAAGLALPLVSLAVQGVFMCVLQNGVYTLATHVYPPFVRATGVGAAAAVGRIGAVLSSFTSVLALQLGGASSYFWVIAAALALAVMSIALIGRQIDKAA